MNIIKETTTIKRPEPTKKYFWKKEKKNLTCWNCQYLSLYLGTCIAISLYLRYGYWFVVFFWGFLLLMHLSFQLIELKIDDDLEPVNLIRNRINNDLIIKDFRWERWLMSAQTRRTRRSPRFDLKNEWWKNNKKTVIFRSLEFSI